MNEITAMWKRVMSFNFTLTLFRNETINVFKLAEETLDRQKSGVFSKSKTLPFDWSIVFENGTKQKRLFEMQKRKLNKMSQ